MNTIKPTKGTGGLVQSANWLQSFFRRFTFLALVLLSVIAGVMFGATVAYQASMTQEAKEVAALSTFRPNLVTRVIADDGKTVIGEFSLEKRIPVTYDQIPDRMKQAIWAIEDDRFFQHIGFDPIRLGTVVIKNVVSNRRAEGASTLTQQLARALFLSPEKTYTRKIKEILISLQMERLYTKEQIMEMYCNQIFLGSGAYGFEAGSQVYFSKSLKDLTLEESALLAGLPQRPSDYSPLRNEKAATDRRNIVLYRMREVGYISEEEYQRARQTPIKLNPSPLQVNSNNTLFGYFVEEVRQEAEDVFGTRQVQTGGLNIYTSLEPQGQREALRAVRRGLHAYQERHGKKWRGKLLNVLEAKLAEEIEHFSHPDWMGDYIVGEYVFGLVMEVTAAEAKIKFGDYQGVIKEENTKWAGGPPSRLLKKGDLAVFKIAKVDAEKKMLEINLDQLPAVDGGLVCIESKTGGVKAIVGGYDYLTRKFNNATQAERQTGSTFKPFIYAAAIERGATADTIVSAAPFVDKGTGWSPVNYDGSSGGGAMSVREALQRSVNIVAVRLMSLVGIDKSAEVVKRFGLPNPMKRVLPSALGATEEPLLDMTSAYSAFANDGLRVKPHYIKQVTDPDGNLLTSWEPETQRAISPYVASVMRDLMRGVVTGGTATAINGSPELRNRLVCGKTGTVNDFTDAWFIGYTPSYTTGVWIGYAASKRTLGRGEAGGVAALPMWIHFMDKFMKGKPNDKYSKVSAPDKEILARRSELEKQLKASEEEEVKALANDDTADKAKSAAVGDDEKSDDETPKPPEKKTPKMVQEDSDAPARTNAEDRPRTTQPRPRTSPIPADPKPKPRTDAEKKKNKNG